eukprot:contig_34103_g8217
MSQPPYVTGGRVRPYQLEGVRWLIHQHPAAVGGILGDDMGLGKTMQVALFLEYLAVECNIWGPHLIVAPLSVLSSWQAELARWAPSLRVLLFYGSEGERSRLLARSVLPGDFDVLVTSYEQLVSESRLFGTPPVWVWRYMIYDEAQKLKNWNSAVSGVARGQRGYARLLLSGTPLQNNLKELWALLRLLYQEVFSSSAAERTFTAAWELVAEKGRRGGAITGARARMNTELVDAAHQLLGVLMLRRTKASVSLGLPPKTERLVFVPLSPLQHWAYRAVLEADTNVMTAARDAAGGDSGAQGLAAAGATFRPAGAQNTLIQLRKVCNHPALLRAFDTHPGELTHALVADSGKTAMLDKILTAAATVGDRVVVFSQWSETLDLLEDLLNYRQLPYLRLDGHTGFGRRKYVVRRFADPNDVKRVLIVSTRAGGVGLNLQQACVVVMFDSDWNPAMDRQAQDRVHRIGQTRPVTVYRLATRHTCEERILYFAAEKAKLGARILRDDQRVSPFTEGGGKETGRPALSPSPPLPAAGGDTGVGGTNGDPPQVPSGSPDETVATVDDLPAVSDERLYERSELGSMLTHGVAVRLANSLAAAAAAFDDFLARPLTEALADGTATGVTTAAAAAGD